MAAKWNKKEYQTLKIEFFRSKASSYAVLSLRKIPYIFAVLTSIPKKFWMKSSAVFLFRTKQAMSNHLQQYSPPWLHWLALLLALNSFAVIYTLILGWEHSFFAHQGIFPWFDVLLIHLVRWNSWIIFVPLIVRLAKNYRLEARQISFRAVAVHCFASAFVPIAHFVFMRNIAYLLGHSETIQNFHTHTLWWMILRFLATLSGFFLSFGFYWLIVAGVYARGVSRRYHEQELRASRLEAQLSNARLDALKAQLHPHFLFNTLNSISTLLYKDVELADTMIARLGDFLRMTLHNGNTPFVTLGEEFEFVRCYLEIETLRFQDRISAEFAIPPDLLDAAVPNMLLQPLVENAVQHGFSAEYLGHGVITVRAWQDDRHSLTIEVRDTGSGFDGVEFQEGIGLGNTRARIAQLYGAEGHFSVKSYSSSTLNSGTQIRITLPLQRTNTDVERKYIGRQYSQTGKY
jgi:two-component system LytT family sensor kinase